MVRIMETTTTDRSPTEAERYGEEVLNANWLPQDALLMVTETNHSTIHHYDSAATEDPDAFLRAFYLAQE